MNLGLVTTDATHKGDVGKLEEIHPSDWLKGYQVGNVSDTMNGAIYCPELIVNNDCQQFRIVNTFQKEWWEIPQCFHFLWQILSLVGHVTVGAQESIPEQPISNVPIMFHGTPAFCW